MVSYEAKVPHQFPPSLHLPLLLCFYFTFLIGTLNNKKWRYKFQSGVINQKGVLNKHLNVCYYEYSNI